jgi:hypothetical protein
METRVIICYGPEPRSGKTTYITANKSEHDLTATVINHELKLDTSFIEATCKAFHDANNRYCPYYKEVTSPDNQKYVVLDGAIKNSFKLSKYDDVLYQENFAIVLKKTRYFKTQKFNETLKRVPVKKLFVEVNNQENLNLLTQYFNKHNLKYMVQQFTHDPNFQK